MVTLRLPRTLCVKFPPILKIHSRNDFSQMALFRFIIFLLVDEEKKITCRKSFDKGYSIEITVSLFLSEFATWLLFILTFQFEISYSLYNRWLGFGCAWSTNKEKLLIRKWLNFTYENVSEVTTNACVCVCV